MNTTFSSLSRLLLSVAGSLFLLLGVLAPARAADDPLASDLKKLQGKWKATVTTDRGTSVWKIEIKDNKSVLTIETEDGEAVAKIETEFKLEKHGRFKAYTYFNLKIVSGPSEGETRYTGGETKSSIYKLSEDTFTTIGGLRDDDDDKPRLITWSRQ